MSTSSNFLSISLRHTDISNEYFANLQSMVEPLHVVPLIDYLTTYSVFYRFEVKK